MIEVKILKNKIVIVEEIVVIKEMIKVEIDVVVKFVEELFYLDLVDFFEDNYM